jgi:small-conductance mechanosensitive channel
MKILNSILSFKNKTNNMERFLFFKIETIYHWAELHLLKLIFILVGGYILHKVIQRSIEKIIRILVVPDRFMTKEAEVKRENTLIRIFGWISKISIIILVIMMSLQEFGIPIGPIIAGAGIIGLAVGFGGQYLIRDLISGFFIILENQYRIGDLIKINDVDGTVEDISLRMTKLRDMNGTVHHIPHGEITIVSNFSKDYAKINLDIGIAYDASLEKAIQVINEIGEKISEEEYWKEKIVSKPQFLRVNELADSAVILKITGETMPLTQYEVAGELRMRIKLAFDENQIEIPFPQMVVHTKK